MTSHSHTELSKLQIICALFGDDFGDDLYFALQIKESIDAVLTAENRSSPKAFLEAANALARKTVKHPELSVIDLVAAPAADGYSQLALRARLLEALKRTCRFERPLLVLTGLKEAICPAGKRWTARRKAEYQEAIAYARAFCLSRSRPSARLALVFY